MADFTVPFIINGKETYTDKTFEVSSPGTGNVLHKCGIATEVDVLTAVDAAAQAFPKWRDTNPGSRRDILLKAADIMNTNRAELMQHMKDEIHATDGWAAFNVDTAIDLIRDVAGRIATITGSVPALASPDLSGMIVKEPYGVVLAIAPWNAPYILGVRGILYPIAAGNSVVLKGSELSPKVFWAFCSAFHQAGLPDGVLNFVVSDPANAPAVTQALITNPDVKKISFTGSTPIGRIIARMAGENLKPCLMELGGKSPAIVWEDADLDLAAMECTIGSFHHAGQICMSTERIIVHKNVREAFQKKFVETIEKVYPTQGDAPVLVAERAVDKCKKLLQDAVSKGAELLNGSLDAEEITKTRMRPIVVGKVTPSMDLYTIESFGPTVSILEVETEAEALRIANDTEYGLTSAIFTEDLRRALRLARGIESGAVHINHMTIHDESALPHGGAKASGFGRYNQSAGLEEFVRTKNITWKN